MLNKQYMLVHLLIYYTRIVYVAVKWLFNAYKICNIGLHRVVLFLNKKCVCVCVYVRMYIRMYVCMCVCKVITLRITVG